MSARILIADDHDIARQGIAALVSSHGGWEICGEARTGREVLRMAAEMKPDVLVMDILMPDLNGLEAARALRKQLPATRIALLSGHEDAGLIRPAFDAGVDAYVFKTQARVHLLPAIAALLAGSTYLTPEASGALLQGLDRGHRHEEEPGPAESLTAREREITQLLAEGRSNKEVASLLDIGSKTVETHRAAVMRKLGIDSFSELILYAIRHRIIAP